MGTPVTLVDAAGQPVTSLGTTGTVTVTGPLTNTQLTAVTGTAAQTTVATDPTAAGLTELALLRGILQTLQSIDAKTPALP